AVHWSIETPVPVCCSQLCCGPGFLWSSLRLTKTHSTSDALDSLRRIESS
ncbi:hypothetical protein K443DRAFT_107443, partial [Laccaria amethystina LaAM-08-1]